LSDWNVDKKAAKRYTCTYIPTTFLPNAFHGCLTHSLASSSSSLIVRKRLSYDRHTITDVTLPHATRITDMY